MRAHICVRIEKLSSVLKSCVAQGNRAVFIPGVTMVAILLLLFMYASKLMSVVLPCRQLAAKWNMPMELATDLASLALYDIVIYADDSGSMIFEEGGDRINDLKLILGRVAEVSSYRRMLYLAAVAVCGQVTSSQASLVVHILRLQAVHLVGNILDRSARHACSCSAGGYTVR